MFSNSCQRGLRHGFIRLSKQRLVYDPHVVGRRGLAIGKILEQKISRLVGELAPGDLNLEAVVDRCGRDPLNVGLRSSSWSRDR